MNNGIYLQTINIQLDSSVKSITKVAAMCLSGAIDPNIKICKDRIEFGKCYTPELQGFSGNLYPTIPLPNFYLEFGNLIYYYDKSAYKHSLWSKELDYRGIFPPTSPDDPTIFNLIYPKFAK